jgi:hypothetical protein
MGRRRVGLEGFIASVDGQAILEKHGFGRGNPATR